MTSTEFQRRRAEYWKQRALAALIAIEKIRTDAFRSVEDDQKLIREWQEKGIYE